MQPGSSLDLFLNLCFGFKKSFALKLTLTSRLCAVGVNAIFWRSHMKTTEKFRRMPLLIAVAVGLATPAIAGAVAGGFAIAAGHEKGAITVQGKFYCNIKALTPTERARHKQLTEKLISIRKEVVETEKGYEFQYGPADVTLAELAEWVVAEGKCCPFFDFHIDLEHAGALLCLRLTGEDGIKAFIRSEFPGVGK